METNDDQVPFDPDESSSPETTDHPSSLPPIRHDTGPLSPYAPPLFPSKPAALGEWTPPPKPSPNKPRIWPVFVVTLIAMPVAVVVAILVPVIVLVIVRFSEISPNPQIVQDQQQMKQWFEELIFSRVGLFALLLPGQIVFFTAAVAAASFSSQPITKRLALVRGNCPIWAWPALMLATPVIGYITSVFVSFFVDETSEHIRMMNDMFRSHAGLFIVVVVLLVSVAPGICEEVLFRGYIQSRLLRRWHPLAAIGFSAAIFAAAHLDPLHVVAVFPMGVWLGIVAWRSGSVLPAMLCHMANNAIAVVDVQLHSDDSSPLEGETGWLAFLAVCGVAFLIAVFVLVVNGPKSTESDEQPAHDDDPSSEIDAIETSSADDESGSE